MNGTDGSTTFTDSSSGSITVSSNNGTDITTDEFKFGGSSGNFDGFNNYLSMTNGSTLDISSGDFTIETWFYDRGTQNTGGSWEETAIMGSWDQASSDNWILAIRNGRYLQFHWAGYSNSTYFLQTSSDVYSLNTWNHIAVTRNGNDFKLWLNGTVVASGISATNANGGGTTLIGRYGNGSAGFSNSYYYGYLDEVRITKGVARYTADFIPPNWQFPDQV